MKIGPEVVLINTLNEAEYEKYIRPAKEEVFNAIKCLRWPLEADGFYFNPKSKTKNDKGKKVGGNGVTPIKLPFIKSLKEDDWIDEFSSFTSSDIVTSIREVKKHGKSKTLHYGTIVRISREDGEVTCLEKEGETFKVALDPDFQSELSDEALIGKLVAMKTATPGDLDACKKVDDQLFVVEWETGNVSSSHRALNKMSLLMLKKHIIGGILIVPNRNMYKYLTDRIGNYEELKPYFDFWRSCSIEKGYLEIIVIEHDGLNDDAGIILKGTDGRANKETEAIPKENGERANTEGMIQESLF